MNCYYSETFCWRFNLTLQSSSGWKWGKYEQTLLALLRIHIFGERWKLQKRLYVKNGLTLSKCVVKIHSSTNHDKSFVFRDPIFSFKQSKSPSISPPGGVFSALFLQRGEGAANICCWTEQVSHSSLHHTPFITPPTLAQASPFFVCGQYGCGRATKN